MKSRRSEALPARSPHGPDSEVSKASEVSEASEASEVSDPVDEALRNGWAAGRIRWDPIRLTASAYARHVRSVTDASAGELDLLKRRDLVGLYLAGACASGDCAAHQTFDATFTTDIEAARRRVGLHAVEADDFRQQVLEHLLVSQGGPTRIGTFAGRASLRTWVRLCAGRLAIDARRHGGNALDTFTDDVADARTALGPEAGLLDGRYRTALNDALRTSLRQLTPGERLLLRWRYGHGLTVSDLARARGVHRVTMSRELTRIRAAVLTTLRAGLVGQLGIRVDELDSIVGLLPNRIDATLSSLLGSTPNS